MEPLRELLTPDQAADYLQLNRETVYRYIRAGKLVASRLGKTYRIPKRSVDLLLWTTRTAPNVALRQYTGQQVADFLDADRLDEAALSIAERFLASIEKGREQAAVTQERNASAS